jgi:hypothetical protein
MFIYLIIFQLARKKRALINLFFMTLRKIIRKLVKNFINAGRSPLGHGGRGRAGLSVTPNSLVRPDERKTS